MMHSRVLSQDLNYDIIQATLLFTVAILDNAEGLKARVTACRRDSADLPCGVFMCLV